MGELAIPDNPIDALPVLWQSSLVMDVAMGVPEDTICEAYDLQYPQLVAITEDPAFLLRLGKVAEDLKKHGASFRMKAQMQAEELLNTSFTMIHDTDIDPKVRGKLIADTIRWAGYDNSKEAQGEVGPGISINIDLGNATKMVEGRVFDHED